MSAPRDRSIDLDATATVVLRRRPLDFTVGRFVFRPVVAGSHVQNTEATCATRTRFDPSPRYMKEKPIRCKDIIKF